MYFVVMICGLLALFSVSGEYQPYGGWRWKSWLTITVFACMRTVPYRQISVLRALPSAACIPHVCVSASARETPPASARVWGWVCVWVDSSSRFTPRKPWNKRVCGGGIYGDFIGRGEITTSRNQTINLNPNKLQSTTVHFPKPHLMTCRW